MIVFLLDEILINIFVKGKKIVDGSNYFALNEREIEAFVYEMDWHFDEPTFKISEKQ